MKFILIISFLLFGLNSFSQNNSKVEVIGCFTTPKDSTILTNPEINPEFPGGEQELIKYIRIKKENVNKCGRDIHGIVFVNFIVSKNGEIKNPTILRGVDNCQNYNDAAIKIVKEMPNWIPGKNGGEKVNVYYNLSIKF
jgi:hypothetical protein